MAQLVKHLFASIDGETIEQRALELAWLELIRDHIMTSFHIERDNLDYAPFDAQGDLGKMHQHFGDQMDALIDELNRELVA